MAEFLAENHAFIKTDDSPALVRDHLRNQALFQRLETAGIIPQVLMTASNETEERYSVVRERINGFTLESIPPETGDLRFSVGFAQDLARIFVKLRENNAYHGDIGAQNVMYDNAKNRFVFVDLEELTGRKHPYLDYVTDYSRILVDTYTGIDILGYMDELAHFADEINNEELKKFVEENGARRHIYDVLSEPGKLSDLLNKLQIGEKVNPHVLDFLAKALRTKNPRTDFTDLFKITIPE